MKRNCRQPYAKIGGGWSPSFHARAIATNIIPTIFTGQPGERSETQIPATYRTLQTFPPACGSVFPDRFCWHHYSIRSPVSALPSLRHQGKSGVPASSVQPE